MFRRRGVILIVLAIPFSADMYLSGFPWVAAIGGFAGVAGLCVALVVARLVERGHNRDV
jgi:hypothetical protein